MTAGLEHARGDAVVVIDADLQDPPEVIPASGVEWRAGFDMVYARREPRWARPALKKATARGFYASSARSSRIRYRPTPAISACCAGARSMPCGSCASTTVS